MSASDYIKTRITQHMPDATVAVSTGDDVHFEVVVTSSAFQGLSLVAQHRLVHQALGLDWADRIHAIALTTHMPQQEH